MKSLIENLWFGTWIVAGGVFGWVVGSLISHGVVRAPRTLEDVGGVGPANSVPEVSGMAFGFALGFWVGGWIFERFSHRL